MRSAFQPIAMRTPFPSLRGICRAAATAACAFAILLAVDSRARADTPASPPVYTAQTCCTLCPRAADPAAYTTPTLRLYSLQVEGRDGWLFRSNIDLASVLVPKDAGIYGDLARMYRALKALGTEVIFLPTPPRGLVEARYLKSDDRARYDYDSALKGYGEMLRQLRNAGFIVPDYTQFANEPEGTDSFYFRRDSHWRPSGASRTARLIADTVKSLGLNSSLRKAAFTSSIVGIIHQSGVDAYAASVICGGRYPPEIAPKYQTTAPAPGELFGDEQIPDVTLVGSSMSANEDYHFAGFLENLLQTDVFNAATAGGALDGGMTQYLMSDVFRKHPPKLLIWEVPYHDVLIATHETMRRLLPLVAGGCLVQPSLLENSLQLKYGDDPVDVIYNGGSAAIKTPARDLILDLQFDNPSVREIIVEAWYLNGEHEVLRQHYNDYTNAQGRFVFEPGNALNLLDQPLVDFRIQLVTPVERPTTVKARLCSVP